MDPHSAIRVLKPSMARMKQGAEDRCQAAVSNDGKFEDCLSSTCKLYVACVQKSPDESESQAVVNIHAAADGSRLCYQAGDDMKKVAQTLRQQLDAT